MEIQKGSKTYFGVQVLGTGGILQSKASEVLLYIPKEVYGFIYGYIHTDPGPFLQYIPKTHCLVAPIVEYHYAANCITNTQPWFKIKVPHRIRKKQDLQFIQVRHGDIHKGIAFTKLPSRSSFFLVDGKYITICTRHFSQFIYTSCKRTCEYQGVAFIFGKVSVWPGNPLKAALRLYLCSHLFSIKDYSEVRHYLQHFDYFYRSPFIYICFGFALRTCKVQAPIIGSKTFFRVFSVDRSFCQIC